MNVDTGQITAIGRRWADLGELVVDLLAEHAAEPARAVPVPATGGQPAATARVRHAAGKSPPWWRFERSGCRAPTRAEL